ncbi:hypothetical protein HYH02_013900 [Chlamydomonas schloesseri]|uniref:Uncharacterized protein n=1 Tax=Chlamydomonas schloesseri TaxID=2026947 RepID=A0A835SX96_9CHLO|nr:hypothetical protein HYH02_013900 [Chlamydomonas schloesseri]|eukprot:KAG2429949.1 hypothetical protein HYH02_013900 [Chlamydomonas schloesseri]
MAECERLLAEGCDVMLGAACAAAKAGHLSVLQLLWGMRGCYHGWKAEVLEVAVAACESGQGAVLTWLEEEAGVYENLTERGERSVRTATLAAAAARGGHVALLYQLLDDLPPRSRWVHFGWLLLDVAQGCPLPVFRDLCERWGTLEQLQLQQQQQEGAAAPPPPPPLQLQLPEEAPPEEVAPPVTAPCFLTHALCSKTPDWRDKVEYLMAKQPECVATLLNDDSGVWGGKYWPGGLYTSRPVDYQQRLRWAASLIPGGDEALAQHAARCAAAKAKLPKLMKVEQLLPGLSLLGPEFTPEAAPAGLRAVIRELKGLWWQWSSFVPHSGVRDKQATLSALFGIAASIGADLATLRFLHERLGARVVLWPIAAFGSVEQLQWAEAVMGTEAWAAAVQDVGPEHKSPLHEALAEGNLAAATYLRERGPAADLPLLDQVLKMSSSRRREYTQFGALRWWLQQRSLAAWQQQREMENVRRQGQMCAPGVQGARSADSAGKPHGEAAAARAMAVGAGVGDTEWSELLYEVGVGGDKCECGYAFNQWNWLKPVFLPSPVPPHSRPYTTAQALYAAGLNSATSMAVARAAVVATRATAWLPECLRQERKRVEGVMEVRRQYLREVQEFREALEQDEAMVTPEVTDVEDSGWQEGPDSDSDESVDMGALWA